MGTVLSSLLSQVAVIVLVLVCKLVGFRQLSSIGISGDGRKINRRCGGGTGNDNNEVGKDDDSATLAAWCSCSCSAAVAAAMASLRSASGAVHADSHQARRQQRVRRTAAAANNSVQCARCLRAGNQCHPHIQHHMRCCCGCCPAPDAAVARACFCCAASSSQQRAATAAAEATRVGQGDCTSAAGAGEHERDTAAIAPRQKEKNQLAWLSPTGNHHNSDSHCTCCNLNHKLQQHRSHQNKCTSISIDHSRKFTFKNNNNKTLHQQQQQARACNARLTTSGKTRHCKLELNSLHRSSETSAGESVGASDEEDADAESTSSQSSNTSISIRTLHQARAPIESNNSVKLNQLQVLLPLADHKFYLDDSAVKPLLQGKITINTAKYSNKSKDSLDLLDLNLLELKTTETITKTTTTTTTKLKFTPKDTNNGVEQVRASTPTKSVRAGDDVDCDMAVLMSSQVPTAAAAATANFSRPQLPRQMAQTASNRQLKRQANLRSEAQHVEGPTMCTNDNNLKQKKQVQQKQKQLVNQQKGTSKNTSEKPITSRTFYSQSSSSSSSSEPSTAKNRNIVKLSKQQRKLSANNIPLAANVNNNRQVTGQLSNQRRPPASADSLANQKKLEQIAAQNKKYNQYKQQQQYNKFTFDRNHIRSRENRSLSTCSSITTESNESSSAAAPPSSSSSANYSPASSGYSSPCSSAGSGGPITTISSHLCDKIKKFKPQPIEIKTHNKYQVNGGSPAQASNIYTPSSVASSVDSGTGASLVDLATVRQQQPLHPTVSALLMPTANLSLTPSLTSAKISKKVQQQAYKNHMNLSRSPSSSTSSSPAADNKPVQYTQDATYLARLEELAPPPMLAAPVAPPRPWLKPEEQLNYLSKSRLRQLKRSMDLGDHHLNDSNSKRRSISTSFSDRDQEYLMSSNVRTAKTNTIKLNRQQQQQQQVSSSGEFTVLSYNVLSDRMVNKERFPSSPAPALNWLYRRELILSQLLDYDADVIALQELESEQYETYFKPKLEAETGSLSESKQVYCGVFEPKSRARTMDVQMRKRVDGCAIFYKRHKFRLVAHHLLEYNQIAMANARGCEAMLNRVMTKDNIGLAAVLELRNGYHLSSGQQHASEESHASTSSKQQQQQQQPRRLIVCNTHIHWDPDCCDVKLVQTIMLMNELKHIARHYSDDLNNNNNSRNYSAPPKQSAGVIDQNNLLLLPLVLLGDFNSLPKSGVLEFLLQANIDSKHKDFKDIRYTRCSNALALRDSAQHRASSGSPDGSSGLSTLLAPGLLRRASQQPTGDAAAAAVDNTGPSRKLPAFEPELLSRRLSSPITNSTTATKIAQNPSRIEQLDRPLQEDEMILHYEHPFRLASAYERGVMPFTNYTTHFKATIDYIFFDQTHVELTGLLGPLDKQWLKANRIQGFPQLQFPSDHLPLLARFQLRDIVSRPAPVTANSVWPTTSAVLLKDCHVKAPVL